MVAIFRIPNVSKCIIVSIGPAKTMETSNPTKLVVTQFPFVWVVTMVYNNIIIPMEYGLRLYSG